MTEPEPIRVPTQWDIDALLTRVAALEAVIWAQLAQQDQPLVKRAIQAPEKRA